MFTPDDILRMILKTYSGMFAKPEVRGCFPLPKGPKVIAANHTLASDALIIPLVFDEKVHFLLQTNLFQLPLAGPLLKLSGQIPVESDSGRVANAFEIASRALAEGKTIIIFPEGQLVPPGERVRARSGVIRLALQSGAPIIPLGMYVAPQNMLNLSIHWLGQKRTGLWQVSGKCHLNFGAPWRPCTAQPPQAGLHAQTRELMDRIYALVSETQKEQLCVSPTSLNPILP